MTLNLPLATQNKGVQPFIWLLCVISAAAAGLIFQYQQKEKREAFRLDCKRVAIKQDWSQLELKAKSWIEWDEQAHEARLHLADAYVNQGSIQKAVDTLTAIPEDYENYREVLAVMADLLFSELQQPFAAEKVWKELLDVEPRASIAIQRLIYFYAITLQRAKMFNLIMQATESGLETPECYAYIILANDIRFSNGLALTTRWRGADRENEVLEVAQAVYAATTGINKEIPKFGTDAVMPGDQSLFEECRQKYPNNLELLALTADQAIFSGDATTVGEAMKNAPESAGADNRFWRYRGWLLQNQGKLQAAEKAFRKSLELHPFSWRSRLLLADVLRKLNQPDLADGESKLAQTGKDLTSRILSSPNARDLDIDLVEDMLEYVREAGPEPLARAFAARLQ